MERKIKLWAHFKKRVKGTVLYQKLASSFTQKTTTNLHLHSPHIVLATFSIFLFRVAAHSSFFFCERLKLKGQARRTQQKTTQTRVKRLTESNIFMFFCLNAIAAPLVTAAIVLIMMRFCDHFFSLSLFYFRLNDVCGRPFLKQKGNKVKRDTTEIIDNKRRDRWKMHLLPSEKVELTIYIWRYLKKWKEKCHSSMR